MDIQTIDTHFQGVPNTIASYLLRTSDGAALIETGPGTVVENIVGALANYGLTPQDIKHVLVTHIHFDHAGAAGWWAQQGAQIYIHERGAPHLIKPERLIRSATRIYGDDMKTLWGDIIPIPAEQVTILRDNDVIELGDTRLVAWDTPGHATHHHVYVAGDVAFVGDLGATRLMGLDHLSLIAPPPEFDAPTWLNSISRVRAANFKRIYLTHFGAIDTVEQHWGGVEELIKSSAAFVQERRLAGVERDAIVEQYRAWNRVRGQLNGLSDFNFFQYETSNPLYMSVDGIRRYWRKLEE